MSELDVAGRLVEMAQRALPSAEIEATVDRNRLALTRFANSVIHQNVAEDTTAVHLRVHADGRSTAGSSTALDDAGLSALVARTVAAVRVAPRDPGWPGLAPP
ncbi:MAG: TldD/PmbA family protein, partial [Actinomycetota bacterium]|nr:TldD/PmbA family protein [Actinomycetota bacterium]